MIIPGILDYDILTLGEKTTLGAESLWLERTENPPAKTLFIGLAIMAVGFLIIGNQQSLVGFGVIVSIIGACFAIHWGRKKTIYTNNKNRYKWITHIFKCTGMVFRGELEEAKQHCRSGPGTPRSNAEALKQTCSEMIALKFRDCAQPCAVYRNLWSLNTMLSLNVVLDSMGDKSLSGLARGSDHLMQLLVDNGLNSTRMTDPIHYGKLKASFSGPSSTNIDIPSFVSAMEASFAGFANDPLSFMLTDADEILDVLYFAAMAKPPVSSDVYNRLQALSQILMGIDDNILSPDAMLAHLVRCSYLSLDRANREASEAGKWVSTFIKQHSGDSDFHADQFICSFCGALKLLELYDLEKACLAAAEKSVGVLNTELTARLDYLTRGGGRTNDRAKYYSEKKRIDTLPVDYDAIKMNSSDIEWLFNEIAGTRGNTACLDYALAYRVQAKKITLPSPKVVLQGKSIANEIQRKLGPEAKISRVMVSALNSGETLQCLKIRTGRFPSVAYLLDISSEAQKTQVRLAVCWIPVSNNPGQQKQQCLSLWSKGTGEEIAYMDNIFAAIENDIQRAIDKWNVSAQPGQPVTQTPGQGVVYY